jgi:hypothetical protein
MAQRPRQIHDLQQGLAMSNCVKVPFVGFGAGASETSV